MKNFAKHGKNVIDFKKKMLPLTKEELKSPHDTKLCYICRKSILKRLLMESQRSLPLYR